MLNSAKRNPDIVIFHLKLNRIEVGPQFAEFNIIENGRAYRLRAHHRFEEYHQQKLNSMKFQICELIDRELLYMRLNQKQAAVVMATNQANVSRVRNRRVEQLTLDQLFRYLVLLKPYCRMMVAPY